MSKIVFIVDIEEGHILPTFSLAEALKRRGHSITYLSVLDNEALVREYGFDFYPMFEKVYPKGYRLEYKRRSNVDGGLVDLKGHLQEIAQGYYESVLNEFPADLYILSVWLRFDALILHYIYKCPIVLFSTYPRESSETILSVCIRDVMKMPADDSYKLVEFFESKGLTFKSLDQLLKPLDSFPELVFCPKEMMAREPDPQSHINYIGPCIRKEKSTGDTFELIAIPKGKNIIYSSMGSQAMSFKEDCLLFFRMIINMMRYPELIDLHLILSISADLDLDELPDTPGNVTILNWAPQIEILEISAAAIIHGGFGTVKECIYYGVPMVVLPLGRDQPRNAQLVEQRKLGVSGNLKNIRESDLKSLLLHVLNNTAIRENIDNMQQIFRKEEQEQPGVAVLEKILAANGR